MTLKSCHEGENVVFNFAHLYDQPGVYLQTIIHEGSPIAVMGILHVREGVAECIMACSVNAKNCPLAFVKACHTFLAEHTEKLKLHRMQMSVRVGDEELTRFAEFLGFEREGLMKQYGPQKADYYLYARPV